jgi:uncharacterized protein
MPDPESLFTRLTAVGERKLPPVMQWHPERTGDSRMRIASDGRWYYRDSEIQRPEMVRLFSTILRRDGDATYLVTPAERLSIVIEDAPFLAVDLEASGEGVAQVLVFLTNVGDLVAADAEHPIELRGPQSLARPYVVVRARLDALISRPVYYRLAELAIPGPDGQSGVWSSGCFFPLERP